MSVINVTLTLHLQRMKLNVIFGHANQTYGDHRQDIFMMRRTSIRRHVNQQAQAFEIPMQRDMKVRRSLLSLSSGIDVARHTIPKIKHQMFPFSLQHWRDADTRLRYSAQIRARMRSAFDVVWKLSDITRIFKSDRSILLSAQLKKSDNKPKSWDINTTSSQSSVKRLFRSVLRLQLVHSVNGLGSFAYRFLIFCPHLIML